MIRPPQQANDFTAADAPLHQLRLPLHLIFLLLMFLLPALFGRWLFGRFTLPLAQALGVHPAASSALLVHVLMLFEVVLLFVAFRWVQGGRSWRQFSRATRLWPIDRKGMLWALPWLAGSFVLLAAWSAAVQPRLLAFMHGLDFWKERNIVLEINSMAPPKATAAVALIFLSLTVLGSLVEEVYFRGYLQSQMSFAGRFDWVVSGVLYGSHHLWVPPLIPLAMISGWTVALLFKWRNNTWPGIVAHFLGLAVNFSIYLSGMTRPVGSS